MFQDLDSTLLRLLGDPAAPTAGADVSFVTPDKTFAPTQPTVNLFLYDVKENRDLRDPTPILQRVGQSYVRRPPPVRVDCSYIVTTWSNRSGAAKVEDEHRLLGQSLQWLSRFPTVPASYAQGSLVGQAYPPPTLVAQVDPNKNAGEFWDALAISPRPAFFLTVTVAMELGLAETGPLVTTHTTRAAPQDGVRAPDAAVQVGGRILDAGGAGVPDALVDVVDAGLRAVSDADGRYAFSRVPVGPRTLRVTAAGFRTAIVTVVIPGLPGDYEVTLTPL
jgi:hypothetical protein